MVRTLTEVAQEMIETLTTSWNKEGDHSVFIVVVKRDEKNMLNFGVSCNAPTVKKLELKILFDAACTALQQEIERRGEA